uniref:Protein translocase subunit SecA n=1 Tax=Ditylenchus dipsaci TaxID=166011 RepID=A0A915DC30_9BILA
MTGTIGSVNTQEFMARLIPIDFLTIPTYKAKKFEEYPAVISQTAAKWHENIISNIQEHAVEKQRAVLVILLTIQDVNTIEKAIKQKGLRVNVRIYSRNDTNESLAIRKPVDSGTVILATNLAGRGTDIKTTSKVEDNGGLHVCLTFLTDNLRIEQQAFGRTSRQGHSGSAQLVLNQESLVKKFGENVLRLETIEQYKALRDLVEKVKIEAYEEDEHPYLTFKDEIFFEFSQLMQSCAKKENLKCSRVKSKKKY